MKISAFLLFMVFAHPFLIGQNGSYFNRDYDFGYNACVFNSLVATDSCYFVSGVFVDTVLPYNRGCFLAKFDLNGNPKFLTTQLDSTAWYETWDRNLAFNHRGFLMTQGYVQRRDTNNFFTIQYSPQGGIAEIRYYDHVNEDLFNPSGIPRAYIHTRDSGGLMITEEYNYHNVPGYSKENFGITKLDSLGDIEWQKTYSNLYQNIIWSAVETARGYILAGYRTNLNLSNYKDYVRLFLYEIDFDGNEIREYISPWNQGMAMDILLTDDGGYIVAAMDYDSIWVNMYSNNIKFQQEILKLDSNFQLVWKRPFRSSTKSIGNITWKMLDRGNGEYIVCGSYREFGDSLRTYEFGSVACFNADGDSLWHRKYNFSLANYDPTWLNDVRAAPDGGLILCGTMVDYRNPPLLPDSAVQRGWLLKLDEYGCLVPGCHLVPTTEPDKEIDNVLFYPNPASSYLICYIKSIENTPTAKYQARILDVQGRVVQNSFILHPEVSNIIDVSALPTGQYILELHREDTKGVPLLKRFVVQR